VTEPLRISDDVDPALARLLRAGQEEAPPRHALQKTLAGMGVATTVIGASQVAGAAVTVGKLGVWSLAKWAGAGVVSGVIAVGGVELVQHGIESSRGRGAETSAAATPATHAPRRTTEAQRGAPSQVPPVTESEISAPGEGSLAVKDLRSSSSKPGGASLPAPLREPEKAAEIDSTISVELGLIDEARRALQAGRSAAALDALRRHRSEVKRPRLAPEAQYLEMEALFASGNASAAQAAARALLARYSKGPHAARAQAILGGRAQLR
jgi:hypothetical protein